MGLNVKDLLNELTEGAEKTAEEAFVNSIVGEEATKEASAKTEETEEEEVTKEASTEETEEATKEAEAATEEEATAEATKEAEAKEETKEEVTSEKTAEEKIAAPTIDEETWVKMASDFGKIAAYSLYSELVALGIMPASNMDMVVPTISSVSLPQESPVTMAGEAKTQNAVGHDGFDERTKKASVISPDFLEKFHKQIFNNEEEN